MSVGLQHTLDVLRDSRNHAADDLLAEWVVQSEPSPTTLAALDAIVQRQNRDALFQLIVNYQQLHPAFQSRIGTAGNALSYAIRQAYLADDEQVHRNAIQIILEIPAYDQVALIVGSLEQDSQRRQQAAQLLKDLTLRLADETTNDRPGRSFADLDLLRRQFIATLENALKRFPKHKAPVVPESILILSDQSSSLVRETLSDPKHPSHAAMVDVLRTSCDPRVLRWLFWMLETSSPPNAVLLILSTRKDDWFVDQFLAQVHRLAVPAVQAAVKLIREFAWLKPQGIQLSNWSPQQQKAAVILITNSGIPLPEKLAFVASVLRDGSIDARRAAACTLAQFPGADATRFLLDCLDDHDAGVQLAAVLQLRTRGLPNGLALLIPKLDHPDERIREAVRKSLSDYTFERFVRTFDQMDEHSRSSLGPIIARIDPNTDEKIRELLQAKHRNHRIRATKIVQCLGICDDCWRDVLPLLDDEDHVVRRCAIELLEQVHDTKAKEQLLLHPRFKPENVATP